MVFDKIKQFGEAKRLEGKMKKELRPIVESLGKGGLKVKVNGLHEVVYIEIDGEDREDLVRLINKANKKVTLKAAKKMMEMGGGLSGLLGGLK